VLADDLAFVAGAGAHELEDRAHADLPVVLDGGHLAFYAAEAVRRKPVSAKGQEWAFRTGLAFVLALMLFVTANDIISLRLLGG